MAESEAPDKAGDEATSDALGSDLQASRSELEDFARSDRVDLLLAVLEKGLVGSPDEETFSNVRDAGILLAGEAGFSGLVWAADNRMLASSIKSLSLSQDAEKCITKILALHGPKLRAALHRSDVPASHGDDWEGFARKIFWDERTNEHLISTEIVKYNGESLKITAGLGSAVRLADQMISILLDVRTLGSVAEGDRKRLESSLLKLTERLQQEAPESEGSDSSE